MHYTDTALCLLDTALTLCLLVRALTLWESLSTSSHNKGSPRTREPGNYRISCQLNLQCAGNDSCTTETKPAFWEKELCRMERSGMNKEPWNASPFQLAIEIPRPGQEVGVYITTSPGGYFRLLALLM